jgi:hypothetical protein
MPAGMAEGMRASPRRSGSGLGYVGTCTVLVGLGLRGTVSLSSGPTQATLAVGPISGRNPSRSSFAVWKRRAGLRSTARANHASNPSGTSATSDGTTIGSRQIAVRSAGKPGRLNGKSPVRHSKVMTPRLQRSERVSTSLPSICSGLA